MVGNAEPQGSAAAAFPDDHGDDGYAEARHFAKVHGDGFGLATLFGVDTGVGSGGVEQGNDRAVELGREAHHAQRLPVSFGLGHTEITVELLFSVAAFLLAEDHHRASFKHRHSGDDSGIIGVGAVAVQLQKRRAEPVNVIEGVRTLGMPC